MSDQPLDLRSPERDPEEPANRRVDSQSRRLGASAVQRVDSLEKICRTGAIGGYPRECQNGTYWSTTTTKSKENDDLVEKNLKGNVDLVATENDRDDHEVSPGSPAIDSDDLPKLPSQENF
ncbi:hypothetical protein GE061_017323 [Apolygus lucorum]|uniref:Uncharacterized protein n=1 Tax=Apolygus lucorum TaxID=248454 RepID=A0A8S9XCW4_APOLU|nr:hypothetical protein GE061_017323 [Apolygus lucorum]